MDVAVRKMGNSAGILLPKSVLAELGVKAGDRLAMSMEAGCVKLVAAKPHPRAGWAEASKKMAEAGEDGLVWPEFGNLDDDKLEW